MPQYPIVRVEKYSEEDLEENSPGGSHEDPMIFKVTVDEEGSSTRHQVTVDGKTVQELTGGKSSPEKLIEASFRYLLERERKESILSNFDLVLITSFFPGFPGEIKDRLLRK